MTREDVIRKLVNQAGTLWLKEGPAPEETANPVPRRFLEIFAALVANAEREACAKVCERIAAGDPTDPNNDVAEYTIYGVAMECRDAIDARSNT